MAAALFRGLLEEDKAAVNIFEGCEASFTSAKGTLF